MTDDQRLSAIIDSWLVEGPKRMPERVMDVVADRISHQSQRPAWRFPGRELHMTTYPRIAAAVAAIVILAIGGIYLFGQPGGSGVGGPLATPSPSPSTAPTPTASPAQLTSFTFKPRVTVQAPAGWTVDGDEVRSFGLKSPDSSSGPGPGSILVMSGPFVGAKDADCEGRPAVAMGASTAELVAALTSSPTVVATSAGTAEVGNRTGQVLDIQLAATWTGTCNWNAGKPAALLFLATAEGPGFGIGATERARVILVDVGGTVAAIIVSPPEGSTATSSFDQAAPIVQTIQFTP
jgi:hypothetical protein